MATVATAPSTLRGRFRASLTRREWRSLNSMFAFIVALHVVGWTLLVVASTHHYGTGSKGMLGVGTGVLAYTLGMRHAFDADHIAAIDNTTRKFMSEGKRPLSTGFWFSLGHSSVVFLLAILLNFGIRALTGQVRNSQSGLHHYTGLIGTLVSGTFLYLIAALNVAILVSIVGIFFALRRGEFDHDEL